MQAAWAIFYPDFYTVGAKHEGDLLRPSKVACLQKMYWLVGVPLFVFSFSLSQIFLYSLTSSVAPLFSVCEPKPFLSLSLSVGILQYKFSTMRKGRKWGWNCWIIQKLNFLLTIDGILVILSPFREGHIAMISKRRRRDSSVSLSPQTFTFISSLFPNNKDSEMNGVEKSIHAHLHGG